MAPDSWKRLPLGDFVTLQRGHDLPDDQRRPGTVPILGSFGITGWHDQARAPGPGLTVGRSGASFGVVSYSSGEYWPLNTALYVIDFHANDPRFAYYFLKQFDFSGFNSGSAQPSLNRNFIHPVQVDIPPISEQRSIAHILGTLDDKIELNRRMNETLEAMARALFKSWFVDFDPVRAKAGGRDPGLPKLIADLFPNSFEDSELGEIPKGWKAERLSDLMTFEGGSQPPASEFVSEPRNGFVRLVQIRDFSTDAHMTFVPDTARLRKFTEDDIMIARYGSSGNSEKMNDSLARVCRGLSGAYNVALVKVVPLRDCREFLFCFLRSPSFQSTIKGMGARSVQSGFRKEDIQTISLVTAPRNTHAEFEKFANSIWRSTFAADANSITLASLRDALLPKLISGEIRVKDAERLTGDVV